MKMGLLNDQTVEDLQEALRAITSLLSKCEKAQDKFSQGKSQHTLLKNRINALRLSSELITKAIEEKKDCE